MSLKHLKTICRIEGDAVSADAVARVDRIVQSLTALSRAGVRGLLDHGCVTVNGEKCDDAAMRLRNGDVVEVRYNPHQRYKEIARPRHDPAFKVLHEDEDLIVVDKAAHVLTVPSPHGESNTLVQALEKHLNRGSGKKRIHVVHRLDRGTSGVLVFAKSFEMARRLKDQFAARKPDREYIAIVAGAVEKRQGTFRTHLATDGTLNRYSTKKSEKGQLAITHYEVISVAKPARGDGPAATIVRVRLETGRRNQIRVHFAEAGHPVLGDPRYPRDSGEVDPDVVGSHPWWKARRLALHAASLAFEHPATGKVMRFESPLPTEFERFVKTGKRAGQA